jgi:hypothetical protein
MEDDAEILREVAHDYVSWNGSVMAALAALLDDIEIAAGLEDIFSINALVDIARTVLGNAESACGRARASRCSGPSTEECSATS